MAAPRGDIFQSTLQRSNFQWPFYRLTIRISPTSIAPCRQSVAKALQCHRSRPLQPLNRTYIQPLPLMQAGTH